MRYTVNTFNIIRDDRYIGYQPEHISYSPDLLSHYCSPSSSHSDPYRIILDCFHVKKDHSVSCITANLL